VSLGRDNGTAAPAATVSPANWWQRENVLPLLVLLVATAIAWGYVLRTPMHAPAMHGMRMPLGIFLFGWTVMMVAMMLPATLPLILLYHSAVRKQSGNPVVRVGLLIAGYFAIWTAAGLPVYVYSELVAGPRMAVLPALLLIAGGLHQFTSLKHGCHKRCSSPWFFLMRQWRPGAYGAARLGALHGIDCLGCCLGLMSGLLALGMMNVGWMLAAAVIIVAEKTHPRGHLIARPLGVGMLVGGIAMFAGALS
jgi:predicted metal-binding membrane protein